MRGSERPLTSTREALIDTGAISANVARLKAHSGVGEFIAVVKANGYGHGAAIAARAAIAGGATRLGVADLDEAFELISAGVVDVPILAWLHGPQSGFDDAVAAGVELGISSESQLRSAATAATSAAPALVHLKVDTGLSRSGAALSAWSRLCACARAEEVAGRVRVRGILSHLSGASPEDDLAQLSAFERALTTARRQGLRPALTHLAATAATLTLPPTRLDAVRVGVGIYGLSPLTGRAAEEFGLRPAMTLRAAVSAVRRVPTGQGVSYDYTYRAPRPTTLALVPLGYADGVPRQASGGGSVTIRGRRHRVAGRIAMDQLVVDVGDAPVEVGDVAVIFGDPADGVASATDWADAAGTINYDIVTRVGRRVARVAVGG